MPSVGLSGIISKLLDGGLPQIIAGPAGKAISRLIGGAVEIPASYLKRHAQKVDDETEMRTTIMRSIAKAAAEKAAHDPAIIERALERSVRDLIKEQSNREEIAARVIEDLTNEPLPETDPQNGPSDEWMDVFERGAAFANSDRLKDLYARILAGEIRKPGDFSLSTLRVLTVLDTNIAELCNRLFPFVIDGNFVPIEAIDHDLSFAHIVELEEVGIAITGGGGGGFVLKKDRTADGQWFTFVLGKEGTDIGLMAQYPAAQFPPLRSYHLTRAGRDLLKLTAVKPAIQRLATVLWKNGATKVDRAEVIYANGAPMVGGLQIPMPRN